jgi:hypothetical protein
MTRRCTGSSTRSTAEPKLELVPLHADQLRHVRGGHETNGDSRPVDPVPILRQRGVDISKPPEP